MAEKNKKRKNILTSANTLFKEKGYHNTKMEEIAAAAGVGKGTLYEYFKNKQDIFDEACIEQAKLIKDSVEDIKNKDIGFKDKLRELIKNSRTMESHDKPHDKSINNILSYKNIISEKMIKTVMSVFADMINAIEKIVEQGKEEGLVTKSISSEMIACFLVGITGQYLRVKSFNENNLEIADDDIIDLFFNGFGVK